VLIAVLIGVGAYFMMKGSSSGAEEMEMAKDDPFSELVVDLPAPAPYTPAMYTPTPASSPAGFYPSAQPGQYPNMWGMYHA
jgi:hypothetical protein